MRRNEKWENWGEEHCRDFSEGMNKSIGWNREFNQKMKD